MPTGSPAQIARILEQRAAALQPRLVRAETASAMDGFNAGRKASGVEHFTLGELARMGHPYSKRRPRPPMFAGIISRHRGLFYAAWETTTLNGAYRIVSKIRNRSAVAKFMRGTSRMIARPVWEKVIAGVQAQRYDRVRRAVKGALKTR